jgi:hypothetical protein
MWYLPVVQEFDHGPFHGRIRERAPLDFPGSKPVFYAMYSRIGAGRQHGWLQEFDSIDKCREFLIENLDKEAEATRRQTPETRERRLAQRIAKITREFLLGKGIGNQTQCQICHKDLTDQASIQRGLGSECWPRFQDHLAKEVPRCEARIEKLQNDVGELRAKLRDEAYWQAMLTRYSSLRDPMRLVEHEKERLVDTIDSFNRDIADTQALQVAARKWLGQP